TGRSRRCKARVGIVRRRACARIAPCGAPCRRLYNPQMEEHITAAHAYAGYRISTDKALLNVEMIHGYLSGQSYWAGGRSMETVRRSTENSICFGVYDAAGRQAGFARVITDSATFGWLCDVFVLDPHRGKDLGKWLVQTIVSTAHLQG